MNGFEPGPEHALHAHEGMDKVYYVLAGRGLFLLADRELAILAPWGCEDRARSGEPRLFNVADSPENEAMKMLAVVAALITMLAAPGCVTCHCTPLGTSDCTCPPPLPRGR